MWQTVFGLFAVCLGRSDWRGAGGCPYKRFFKSFELPDRCCRLGTLKYGERFGKSSLLTLSSLRVADGFRVVCRVYGSFRLARGLHPGFKKFCQKIRAWTEFGFFDLRHHVNRIKIDFTLETAGEVLIFHHGRLKGAAQRAFEPENPGFGFATDGQHIFNQAPNRNFVSQIMQKRI